MHVTRKNLSLFLSLGALLGLSAVGCSDAASDVSPKGEQSSSGEPSADDDADDDVSSSGGSSSGKGGSSSGGKGSSSGQASSSSSSGGPASPTWTTRTEHNDAFGSDACGAAPSGGTQFLATIGSGGDAAGGPAIRLADSGVLSTYYYPRGVGRYRANGTKSYEVYSSGTPASDVWLVDETHFVAFFGDYVTKNALADGAPDAAFGANGKVSLAESGQVLLARRFDPATKKLTVLRANEYWPRLGDQKSPGPKTLEVFQLDTLTGTSTTLATAFDVPVSDIRYYDVFAGNGSAFAVGQDYFTGNSKWYSVRLTTGQPATRDRLAELDGNSYRGGFSAADGSFTTAFGNIGNLQWHYVDATGMPGAHRQLGNLYGWEVGFGGPQPIAARWSGGKFQIRRFALDGTFVDQNVTAPAAQRYELISFSPQGCGVPLASMFETTVSAGGYPIQIRSLE